CSEPSPYQGKDRVDLAHVLHVSWRHAGLGEECGEEIVEVPGLVRGIHDKWLTVEVAERWQASFGEPMVGRQRREKRLAQDTDRLELTADRRAPKSNLRTGGRRTPPPP